MSEQLPQNIEQQDNPEARAAFIQKLEASPSVFVKRSNDEISLLKLPADAPRSENGRATVYILEKDPDTDETYIYGTKSIAEADLTPEAQADLAAEYEAAHSTVEQAERDVPHEVAEKFGDAGLSAVGIENPSEINEHAVSFKKGELAALRAAAREKAAMESILPDITGAATEHRAPVIPGLSQMMAEQPPVIPDLVAQMSGEATPEASTTPEQQLIDLTEDLNQDDRLQLRSYAESKIGKREAQKDGDGERSILEGQYMGQAVTAMSDRAKAIKDTYAALFERA